MINSALRVSRGVIFGHHRLKAQRERKGPSSLSNSRARASGVGTRLLMVIFGIGAVSALVAGAAVYAFFEVGRSLTLIDRRIDPILASLEVSRSVERIVTASSALSSVTIEQERERVFAGLSRESRRLQSFLTELRDGGISQERLAPIEGNAVDLDANLTALDADVRLRLQLIGRAGDLMQRVFDTNEETQRLLGPTLLAYDSHMERLAKLLTTAGSTTDPRGEDVRSLIAGLVAAWPVQKVQQRASDVADTLVQASVNDQKQRVLILAFQLRRMIGDLEKGSQALDPKLRPLFLAQVDKLKTLIDGPSSIPELRQHELNLIADARQLLAENANLSNQLTTAAEQLVEATKQEVRAATGSALRVQRLSTTAISVLLVLGFVGSVLIVWLYVGRNIVRRLNLMSGAMFAIAGGGRETVVPLTGNDEIAAMGRAVEVFRQNAIERDALLAERAEAADRLEKKVEERTAELAQSVKELRALGDVSQAVNSTLDVQTVLSTIIARAVQLSGTDAGTIFVFDEASQEFQVHANYRMDQSLIAAVKDQHIRLGETMVSQAALQRRSMQLADAQQDTSSLVLDVIQRAGFRALLTVPLLGADRIVGALVVRRKEPGEFAQSIIDLLETFGAQSVLAIQNARLFSEIAEKSRELAEASQHKSQFLANMSHELRTPLNAILGYTELMADGAYGEPSEKMLGILKRLEANGKHLLGLINDVLDLSKIEAGQLVLELSDYSVQDIAQTVRSTLEPLAADKKLAFKVEMASELPPGHGDGRRLTQVLINLVGNAIKFTDAGEIAIKAEANNGSFHVSVRDTGPGISAADQAKLFQEFQQADNAITRKKGGTGLGLAISKRIIEMHGGRIWVESQLGQGSTFAFSLPVIVERQVEAA